MRTGLRRISQIIQLIGEMIHSEIEQKSIGVLLDIFRWENTVFFLKASRKIRWTIKSRFECYLRNIAFLVEKQLQGFMQPEFSNKGIRCLSGKVNKFSIDL